MPMRLSGLMSGMDTESIISQLVEARKTKVTKAVKAQKSLKYKQDAWKDLNKQIVNLYNKSLTAMRFESSYIKKTTKVSNSNVVSVITGDNAMNSVQSLRVEELARSGFLTGGKLALQKDEDGNPLENGGTVTGKTKLSQLGFDSDSIGKLQLKIGDEIAANITVDGNSTVENFISTLRSAGVNANFDEVNQRIYVSAKASGKDNDFSITATNAEGLAALQALKLDYDIKDKDGNSVLVKQYTDKYNSLVASKDSDISTEVTKRINSLKEQRANWKDLQAELKGRKTGLEDSREKLLKIAKDAGLIDADATEFDYDALDEDAKTAFDEKITAAIAKAEELAAEKEANYDTLDEDEKAAFDEELAEAEALANWKKDWDSNTSELKSVEDRLVTVNSELEGMKDKFNITEDADGNEVVKVKDKVKAQIRTEVTGEVEEKIAQAKAMMDDFNTALSTGVEDRKLAGNDAEIYLNGIRYTSDKNSFAINGLTLTVSAKTAPGEEVTITTEDDTNGIYDMIKNFFKEYNAVINQMDKLYNADSAKGYDPLTDEEKEAMSDSAIEEWENKIKDSILRKDSTLSTFSQAMKTIMMEGVEVNGKMMYLSNFGINTLNYFTAPDNERNAYHIDGDSDDENTANNADKLKAMIANDPDTVVSFFTQLSQKLSDKMFDLMKSREGYSSAMTVYDDKKMQTEYDDYTTKIKDLEKKLADYEDKWYAKFAAMETALAKMQNNASAVTSLLGGS